MFATEAVPLPLKPLLPLLTTGSGTTAIPYGTAVVSHSAILAPNPAVRHRKLRYRHRCRTLVVLVPQSAAPRRYRAVPLWNCTVRQVPSVRRGTALCGTKTAKWSTGTSRCGSTACETDTALCGTGTAECGTTAVPCGTAAVRHGTVTYGRYCAVPHLAVPVPKSAVLVP